MITFDDPPAYDELLEELELKPSAVENLLEAEAFSARQLRRARAGLANIGSRGGLSTDVAAAGFTAFAVGSLGRGEASEASDLDLAFIYDEARLSAADAARVREQMLMRLRPEFDVPEKTFDAAVELGQLMRNVGGRGDTNLTLTYRALLLTEGAWLFDSVTARETKRRLFSVYAQGRTSRGRFLNSLANDLHRYYRTLCVDYRFKVEEDSKSWAIRVLKLRHARKLWHLANLATQCWAVECLPDDARDETVAARLDWPPLKRLVLAMRELGGAQSCAGLFRAQDRFLSAISSDLVREELESLHHADRYESALFRSLHYNAEQLDESAAEVVRQLMERCGPYLIRYCLL